jgi:hypothetical protein
MYRYVIGLLVLVSLSSCEKWTEVKATGLVRDAVTQQPLDSVKVALYEDNEGPFMGTHLLQETTTDASGTFKFNFDYKEGPYKIFVNRTRYRYHRVESDNILNQSLVFESQEIAALEDEQDFIFDMAPQSFLNINLKNVAPTATTDQIKVEVGRNFRNQPALIRVYEGAVTEQISVGNVDGNTYIPIKYEVRENNQLRTVNDSIAIQPFKTATYNLFF